MIFGYNSRYGDLTERLPDPKPGALLNVDPADVIHLSPGRLLCRADNTEKPKKIKNDMRRWER